MSHSVALPFTLKKSIFKTKERTYGNSNIPPCKNIIFFFFQSPLKETKNHWWYYNSIITKSQVSTQAKISNSFQKNPPIKIDLKYYIGAQKSLKLL